MLISGKGIPLDAIRVDYAHVVEKIVLEAADAELAIIEGQGSVVHPGSTRPFTDSRILSTHLALCHRAGMTHLDTVGDRLQNAAAERRSSSCRYCNACGAYRRPRLATAGIVLNTGHLDEQRAHRAIQRPPMPQAASVGSDSAGSRRASSHR